MIATAQILCLSLWLLGSADQDRPAGTSRPDYVVGPQDVLTITVFEEPQLTGRYTVSADGALTFPMVGRVGASGLTLRGIEDKLTKLLADGYLKNPQVSVEVEQYRSQSVTVTGEVRSPGKYMMTGQMTLLDALVQAGSVTALASTEVQIMRPRTGASAGAAAEILKVEITDLQAGKLSQNVTLRDGDTVFVPKAQPVFVTGQVRSPGAYAVQRGMTVLQALSLAGGVSDRGSSRRIKLIRIVNGKKRESTVKLTDLVQPGDTIVVPQRFF
ncbi:MAG: polysaccharide biosynthesis/export family protein [Acidobacteria bacterium]|nr:polysaccharide biosynthesis/export family protein [Acidobacteriota bacterium]